MPANLENSATATGLEKVSFPVVFPKKNNAPKCSNHCTAAAAKSLQLCPTLCDPIDSSPPGSLIPGILQARTLEWVAISFFKNHCTIALISHASKVMLKIFQARLQKYVNQELPDIQAKKQRKQRSNCQHPLDHRKSKRLPEKHLLLLR